MPKIACLLEQTRLKLSRSTLDATDPERLEVPVARLLAVTACLLSLAQGARAGMSFSIDAASPSTSTVSSAAVLNAGPVGGPPVVVADPFAGTPGVEVDAMTEASETTEGYVMYFSVDRVSVGSGATPQGVRSQSLRGQAAGDLFWSGLGGWNRLVTNQDELGLLPAIGREVAASPPIDDVDALESIAFIVYRIYSLAPGHPYTGQSGEVGCGGDLFLSPTQKDASYSDLGLASCDDDVDALSFDYFAHSTYFSLAPGSPSLQPGSPIVGCAAGCSPADIFVVHTDQPAQIYATAASLGLLPSDNVDAITFYLLPPPSGHVPAVGTLGIALLALLLAASPRLLRAAARRSVLPDPR